MESSLVLNAEKVKAVSAFNDRGGNCVIQRCSFELDCWKCMTTYVGTTVLYYAGQMIM